MKVRLTILNNKLPSIFIILDFSYIILLDLILKLYLLRRSYIRKCRFQSKLTFKKLVKILIKDHNFNILLKIPKIKL